MLIWWTRTFNCYFHYHLQQIIGKVGVIDSFTDSGDVVTLILGDKWVLNPKALSKVNHSLQQVSEQIRSAVYNLNCEFYVSKAISKFCPYDFWFWTYSNGIALTSNGMIANLAAWIIETLLAWIDFFCEIELSAYHCQHWLYLQMSVKCEEYIDELTVQVWLLSHHPNFKYCTLLVSETELRTDRRIDWQTDRQTDKRTDGQTDDPITRCPRRTFQAGA